MNKYSDFYGLSLTLSVCYLCELYLSTQTKYHKVLKYHDPYWRKVRRIKVCDQDRLRCQILSQCVTLYTRSISIIRSCYEWFLFDLNSTPNSYYFTKGTCNLVLKKTYCCLSQTKPAESPRDRSFELLIYVQKSSRCFNSFNPKNIQILFWQVIL